MDALYSLQVVASLLLEITPKSLQHVKDLFSRPRHAGLGSFLFVFDCIELMPYCQAQASWEDY